MGFWGDAGSFIGGAMSPLGLGASILGPDNIMALLTGGATLNVEASRQTNAMNVALNRENRDWMEHMSNSAYQRGVRDMRAAGINPMLAFKQGGASTPSNVAPTVENPNPGRIVEGLMGTAKTAATMVPQVANTVQDTKLKGTQADMNTAQMPKIEAETGAAVARADADKATAELAAQQKRTQAEEEQNKRLQRAGIAADNQAKTASAKSAKANAKMDTLKAEVAEKAAKEARPGWKNLMDWFGAAKQSAAKLWK